MRNENLEKYMPHLRNLVTVAIEENDPQIVAMISMIYLAMRTGHIDCLGDAMVAMTETHLIFGEYRDEDAKAFYEAFPGSKEFLDSAMEAAVLEFALGGIGDAKRENRSH